ncbi:MAG TPA: carbohydrate binding family 9 domain-containing protein, partial [Pyrinomonadaceae bacterium]|nr:carbohydrate binding family 9 domain-containing protein [Pyrinomonadaceae bacterium]
MQKSLAFFAIIFFSFFIIKAQPANLSETTTANKNSDSNTSEDSKKSEVVETKVIPKNGSKVIIPPEKASPVNIPKLSIPLVIDGKIDEEVWKDAAVFKDFYQTNPGDNIAPSKPTEVLLMYDEKNLYVAFKCWDEKDKIRATVAKRDEILNEDNVRMWLDTYNDQRRAYVIAFNPLGIQQDGIFTEGQGADFSVDIVMESKGVIEDWGWSVEAKIPFKSLRYVAGKGKLWGFNAARNIDRLNDEFDQWMPDDRNVSGFLIKHGKISGLDEIKYERTLEIVPSVTISESGNRKRAVLPSVIRQNPYDPVFNPNGLTDPGRFVNNPIQTDLGVTWSHRDRFES